MSQHHVVRGILCGLLLMAGFAPVFAEPDPMLGGYGVGKSEEIVWISATYAPATTPVYIGLYDWDTVSSALVPLDSQLLVTCNASDRGPKQVDIAVGDFNCDGRDDIVAVAQTTDSAFDLIIPRFMPGTLTWGTPYTWSSTANALYYDPDIRPDHKGNVSGLRLLAADLDTIPGQEFVLAYLTPDTNVELVMYKTDSLLNPIPVDSVRDPDKLWTTRVSPCNERSHVFDITAGDFDGDWVDEIMLIGEYKDAGPSWTLFASIYEYSGGSFHHVYRQDSIVWEADVPETNVDFADRIAIAAADYHGAGRDQVLLYLHVLNQESTASDHPCNNVDKQFGVMYGLTVDSALQGIDRALDYPPWYSWWRWNNPVNGSETSEHGLSVADLNLDGNAEFVIRGGSELKVGNWNSDNTITWLTGNVHLEDAFDSYSESRRSVIFADLDFGTTQASWTPELIAFAHDTREGGSDPQGHIKVWDVDIDTGQITGVSLLYFVDLADGALSDTWYPFVLAAGDFDGDGVRLGKPNHVSFTHAAEPLVVLNSPPMHFDILATDTVDPMGFYTEGNKNAYTTYITNHSRSESVETSHESNWNVSASVAKSWDWGVKFSAKLTAAYGGSLGRISGTVTSYFTSDTVTVIGNDQGSVFSIPYEVWEYPLYVGDVQQGYYVVAQPHSDSAVTTWDLLENLSSTSYLPKHEVGNLLSYPASLSDLKARDDVDTVLGTMSTISVHEYSDISRTYLASQIHNNGTAQTRKFSIDLEAQAELFGLELSSTASFDNTKVQTRSSSINDGFQVTTNPGNILTSYLDWGYHVTPVFFWSTAGALVLDYIVDNLDEGGLNGWTGNYLSAPDPAFLLPWRYDFAKGKNWMDSSRVWRTTDVYFRPDSVRRGDVVTIHGKVWNYSLDSLTQDVEVRFYDGDPDCSETSPLLNTVGDSLVVVAGGIGPRGFKPFEFEWEVPDGAPDNARVYVVLDPEDHIAEIHDNNNKCWRGVFVPNPAPAVCTPKDVTSPVVDVLDPDGGGLLTSGTTHLIQWASSDDFGTTSCKLEWSADNGAVYGLIDSVASDTGSYAWVVPDTTTDLARIRVTVYDGAGNSTSDVSDSTFSIGPDMAPVVDLLDPDGGGLLMSGTTHLIQWASSDDFGTTSCKLEWSADNGVVYGLIDSLAFDSCTYAWVVPDTTTDLARIRVTVYDGAGNSTSDVSNSVFSIGPPSECPIVMTGDADENGSITSADIIKMVNFVFKGGVPPGPCEAAGDVNCNGTCTSADIIWLVNFVFKGGTPPCDACTTDPSGWNCP